MVNIEIFKHLILEKPRLERKDACKNSQLQTIGVINTKHTRTPKKRKIKRKLHVTNSSTFKENSTVNNRGLWNKEYNKKIYDMSRHQMTLYKNKLKTNESQSLVYSVSSYYLTNGTTFHYRGFCFYHTEVDQSFKKKKNCMNIY